MKTTTYFEYVRKHPDRSIIKDEWSERTIEPPIETTEQADGRKWSYVEETEKI